MGASPSGRSRPPLPGRAGPGLSEGVGDDHEIYRFQDGEVDALLDLAGLAAHEGGHKTNAPLLCYLIGLPVICRLDTRTIAGVAEPIEVAFAVDRFHFFDLDTALVIHYEARSVSVIRSRESTSRAACPRRLLTRSPRASSCWTGRRAPTAC